MSGFGFPAASSEIAKFLSTAGISISEFPKSLSMTGILDFLGAAVARRGRSEKFGFRAQERKKILGFAHWKDLEAVESLETAGRGGKRTDFNQEIRGLESIEKAQNLAGSASDQNRTDFNSAELARN